MDLYSREKAANPLLFYLKRNKGNNQSHGVTLLPKQFFICVDGILIKDSKILLSKRNVEPFRGFWHAIGGHVEENETLEAALKREFKEETDLDVQIGEVLGRRIEETFDRIKLIVIFQVYDPVGKVKLNEESQEYGWFDHMPPESVYDYSKYLAKPKEMQLYFPQMQPMSQKLIENQYH